ncbi:FG-GAP repeat protein [Oscillatoriales cyanobacterium LEGE 11467]|uniref:FG-GAP repeat protein n=1 Tax=Zarconia navalis LEGE 11467 TaxID=1828826 RepID=A0A928VVG4_9CYAN|nr:hypothetical protein [Zarconia navalis]MBE9040977.1 FG-GAP repeat protein [Zarconia navalis LEGE 11467]
MELLSNETSFNLGSALDPMGQNDPLQDPTPETQITGGAIDPEEPMLLPGDAGSLGETDKTNESGETLDNIILGTDPGVGLKPDLENSDSLTGDTIAPLAEEPISISTLPPLVPEISVPELAPIPLPGPIIPDLDFTLPPLFLPANDQVFSQDTPGVVGLSESSDSFGEVLAAGDFNNDGYADLAVGSPDEDIETGTGVITNAGAVNVLYGTASGLSATNDQIWHQNSTGVLDFAEASDRFGASLTSGDFNNDGYDDLAIGVPGEDLSGNNNVGAANILYGTASGLSATNDQFWHQNLLTGSSEEVGDRFGFSVTSGDFNDDGYDDLAVGAPTENWNVIDNAGAVNVIYGSNLGNGTTHGLNATGNQIWTQDSFGIEDQAEAFDNFGYSLTAGDFDNDGDDDLGVGVPFEDIGTISNAGAVNVIKGSTSRLSSTDDQFWHQNSFSILDVAENSDWFGYSLTAGDYNNDGYDDLGVGVPFEDIGTVTNAGALNVLYGATTGPSSLGDQFWHQDSFGIEGVADAFDNFGRSLTSGDFDNDGYDDLGVGVPFEDIGAISNAGSVNILHGSTSRLSNKNDRLISQNTLDMSDEPAESFDSFGRSLTSGDFNGDGYSDLAVGVPEDDITNGGGTAVVNAGVVNVLYDV